MNAGGTGGNGNGNGGGSGYDRLGIPEPNGQFRYVTRAEFERLPLGDRVRLLMGGTLRFFRNGEQIPAREALRGA